MQPHKLILSILFGFLLVASAQALIEIVLTAYMHYGLKNDFREIHFKYYFLMVAIILAVLLAFLIISVFVRKKNLNDLKLPNHSKLWFVVFVFVLAFVPVVKHVSDQNFMNMYNDYQLTRYLSNRNVNEIFENVDLSIMVSKWTLIVTLFLLSAYYYKRVKT
ncbi:hypothetical protein [uncultured Winogradskyella sp.]|uniref:hypothetical protein n=1 Tax=uncultured Winogradskyella sp. TaxID=395353 RepID=UPI00263797D0|nr:hypothetical protein [uncultured Winogradskyella sp.]